MNRVVGLRRLKSVPSLLLLLLSNLGSALPSREQSHPSERVPKLTPDACPGPWHRTGFEGFNIGMRVPGGMKCLFQSPVVRTEYRRKTSANEYAVAPDYADDYTESRLHPAKVLSKVTVLMDRPASVAGILADFAEARQLCSAGCRIVGLQSAIAPRFAVFPKNPTDEQRAWALRVTST